MTRQKHGNYDASKALPDNRGQAQGSGLYVWLQSEVEQRYGPEIIEQAQTHGTQRYRWLIEQLEAMQSADACALVEEFHVRRKADAAEQRQQQRRHAIAVMQRQIEEGATGQRLTWLTQQIEKIQRSYEKAAKSE